MAGTWSFLVIERELSIVLQIDGVSTDGACAVGSEFGNHALFHCSWEHETAVVVGVFADEVDSARRCINRTWLSTKMLDEACTNVVNRVRIV